MLRLTIEQVELLDAFVQSRHASGIGSVLAQAFPALTARLADRFGAFVEAALTQGRRFGIEHPIDLAGYAGLWCVWGAGFEDKPGLEWAAEILADPSRPATLKVHQLRHRSREELARRSTAAAPASGMGAAEFDAAVARVDAGVAALADSQSVFEIETPWQPVRACDVGQIEMRIVEPAGRLEYRRTEAGWQRLPAVAPALPDLAWSHVDAPPPAQLLLGHALRGGSAARVNLKIQMHAVCDPRVHAEVVHVDGVKRLAWQGRDAARLAVPVYAAPAEAASRAIAAQQPAAHQTIAVASCGQRDAGASFGAFVLDMRVQPATQWLLQVQHPAWLPMVWPNADAVPPPGAQVRLEADGAARPAAPSQTAWAGLQAAMRAGLSKLHEAWGKALEGEAPRLEVQAAALMGQAGLAWGWQRGDTGVAMRCEAVFDWVACAIELTLSGEVVQGAARARIRVICQGRSEWRSSFVAQGDELAAALAGARCSWRYPIKVELDPLAGAGFATLTMRTAPEPAAAIVGECGLRPRADAIGWEWFFGLRVEPLALATTLADPLLGSTQQSRPLLPALTLVDWSAP
ncbi:MAG: hypothetical protein ABIO45_11630 [Burkholderiaceae bacterium]